MCNSRVSSFVGVVRYLAVWVLLKTLFIDKFVKNQFSPELEIVRYNFNPVPNLSINDQLKGLNGVYGRAQDELMMNEGHHSRLSGVTSKQKYSKIEKISFFLKEAEGTVQLGLVLDRDSM